MRIRILLCLSSCFLWLGSGSIRAQVTLNPFPSREIGQPIFNPINPVPTTLSPNLVEGRELFNPIAVAVDTNATPPLIYVADYGNNRVLVWQYQSSLGDPNQEGSFPVANMVLGEADMYTTINSGPPANSTYFNAPSGLVVDPNGNLYVADAGNNRILRFPRGSQLPDMVIGQPSINSRGLANQGLGSTPTDQTLNFGNGRYFVGMVFDSAGNLYVADPGNNRVVRYTAQDLANRVNNPHANLFLGQTTAGSATQFTGPLLIQGTNLPNKVGLNTPTGLAIDSKGRLYVADANQRVMVFPANMSTSTAALKEIGIVNNFPSATPNFSQTRVIAPNGIFILPGDSVGVVDSGLNRILIFPPCANSTSPGTVCDASTWPEIAPVTSGPTPNPGQLSPFATTAIGQGQSNFNTDNSVTAIALKPNGGINGGNAEASPSSFNFPVFATLANNQLYLADAGNNRVLIMPVQGATVGPATQVLGQDQFNYLAPNLLEGREFAFVLNNAAGGGVAIDQDAANSHPPHLYVADTYNNRVLGFADARTLRAGGKADIVIGQPDLMHNLSNWPFNDASKPTASGLNQPTGIAVDSQGNLWVADSLNARVLRFPRPFAYQGGAEPADLVLGQGSATNFTSNFSSPSTMGRPYGLAFDSAAGQDNRLLVSDPAFNRVLRFDNQNGTWNQTPGAVLGQSNFTGTGFGNGLNQMHTPLGLAVDSSGRIYVADRDNNRVLIFGQAAQVPNGATALSLSITSGLNVPQGVFVNRQTGEIWIADTNNGRAVRYQNFDQLSLGNTQPQTTIQESASTIALAQDMFGDLYVADSSNRVVVHYPGLLAVNGANFLIQPNSTQPRPLAPGSLAAICPPLRNTLQACLADDPGQFGSQTAQFSDLPNPVPLPTVLGNIQVTVNGTPAPLFYVSPRQINFQVPSSTPVGQVLVEVTDTSSGQVLGSYPVQIAPYSLGLYYAYNLQTKVDNLSSQVPAGITYQVAATNQDGTPNTPSNCAVYGSTVTLYGTGQGVIPGMPPDGTLSPSGVTTSWTPRVVINPGSGFIPEANVVYSGLAPGEIGIWQINVTIPPSVVPGNDEVFVIDPNSGSSLDSSKLITTLCVKQK